MKSIFSLRKDLRMLKGGCPKHLVWSNIANVLTNLPISVRDDISPKIYNRYFKYT